MTQYSTPSPHKNSPCKKTQHGYHVDLSEMTEMGDRYKLMIQSYVPRPIAWVLTENEDGTYNLAPFSYSAPVAPIPMLFLFSCGMRRAGDKNGDTFIKKDTWANIERTGRCVLHLPSVDNIEDVNNSAAGLTVGKSETDEFNIDLTEFGNFPLPRVKNAPVAYGCDLSSVTEVGTPPLGLVMVQAQQIFLAEHIVESVNGADVHLNETAINPLTRLGKTKYGTLGDVIDIGPPPKI